MSKHALVECFFKGLIYIASETLSKKMKSS